MLSVRKADFTQEERREDVEREEMKRKKDNGVMQSYSDNIAFLLCL